MRAVAASEARLDRTGRLAGVGGWELDLIEQRLYWSDETCRIHGLPAGYVPSYEEAIQFYTPEARPKIYQAFEQAIQTGQGFDLQLPQILRNGRHIWVRAVGVCESVDGRAARIVGAFQDITARVQEHQALEQAHGLVRLAADSGSIGIWDYDLVQGSLKWDPWMYRLYGLAPSETLGPYDLWARHLHPDDRAATELALQEALQGHKPFSTEFRIIWSDGSVHHIRGSALIQRDQEGRAVRMVGVNWDTTEHHRAQADLQEAKAAAEAASQAKSQFLANMSHEIRTPMNAVLGMLTLLRRTPLSDRQADYVVKTEGAARALLGLLNEILDFSKIEAGKMSLDPQPMRLDQLLRDLAVILSASVGSKKLELLFDIDSNLPEEWVVDGMRLRQVLINLTGNAIKFTEVGEVVLSIQVLTQDAASVRVRFAVQDTGIGIAPENQARIFAGFTQAEASTTRRFGGTGLGVAISQRLVALMGGELTLSSELGRGSCFEFTLQLQKLSTPSRQPRPRVLASEPGMRRALVVDDNALCREVLGRLCAAQGWQVELAASGDEAIAMLQSQASAGLAPFQALFIDWQMPGLDGWQTMARIRELGLSGAAPLIVMVTAQDREQLAQRHPSEQALLSGYLVKPITASMLFDAVADAGLHTVARASGGSATTGGAQEKRLAGLRLLLVEDNLNNQQVASELLQDEGAQVQIAGDGQQALTLLAQAPLAFDVVLMDLQMPVMDGLTATRQVRVNLGLRELPIVAMTANAMSADRQACLDAGMNDHVGKPFDLDELVRVLRQQVGAGAAASSATPVPANQPESGLQISDDWRLAAAGAQVDLPAALGRMGGKAAVYQRMLRNFTGDLPLMQSQLRQWAEQGDAVAARMLLHNLKGLAATLGVLPLAAEAGRWESAVAAGAPDWRNGVGAVLQAMAQAGPGLQMLVQRMQAPPPLATSSAALGLSTLAAEDRQALRAALNDLLRLLADSDMAAVQVLPTLHSRFDAVLAAPLEALDDALSRLAFESAAALAQRLLDDLGPG
ncbi:response regulator [Paucibacter sp. Y2R2-4]|nr:response regulator [Paucibacter sp. Y2R2-4]